MIEFALFLAAGLRLEMPWWYFFLTFTLSVRKVLMFAWRFAKELSKPE